MTSDRKLVSTGFTCDLVLPQLVVLEGLLHGLDGRVVDVQQLLHRGWRGEKKHMGCNSEETFWMFSPPFLMLTSALRSHDRRPSQSLLNRVEEILRNWICCSEGTLVQENRGAFMLRTVTLLL